MKELIFNLLGCLTVGFGGVLMYNHAISNLFVLSIVFVTLVYFGVKLIIYSPALDDYKKWMISVQAIAYYGSYIKYKKTGKNDTEFTFDEQTPQLKCIRRLVELKDETSFDVELKEKFDKQIEEDKE